MSDQEIRAMVFGFALGAILASSVFVLAVMSLRP